MGRRPVAARSGVADEDAVCVALPSLSRPLSGEPTAHTAAPRSVLAARTWRGARSHVPAGACAGPDGAVGLYRHELPGRDDRRRGVCALGLSHGPDVLER